MNPTQNMTVPGIHGKTMDLAWITEIGYTAFSWQHGHKA